MFKHDKSENAPEKMEVLVGDVRDRVAILVDDMIDSGSTLVLAAKTLKENGAKEIYALISHGQSLDRSVTHAICSDIPSRPVLRDKNEQDTGPSYRAAGCAYQCSSHILTRWLRGYPQVTNTIPQERNLEECSKLVTIDVAPTIAESIRRTHNGESISLLFGDWAQETSKY